MSVRRPLGAVSAITLLLACAWAGCSTDTSGTGDCDPATDDCPAPERDSSVGADSLVLPDTRVDSSSPDTLVVDGADATIVDTADGAVVDTADGASIDTADGAVVDTRDASEAAIDTADSAVPTDTADAATGDSGLASDPTGVRCRAATNCALAEGDVCCTPQTDTGTTSPWRCWDKFTCVAGTGMECDETADCAAADKCCASSTSATVSSCQPTCSGVRLCMTDAECGTGKSCVPFTHVSGAILGSCSP